MKKAILFLITLIATSFTWGQTIRTVNSTSGDYTTLKAAFAAINAGLINGQIVLQITGNTTETATAILNASGTGAANYTSINIYPSISGCNISSSSNIVLIDLNGADNVTIDGRVNQTGLTKDLTITNTSSGNIATSLRFSNSAENNVVRYCNISSSVYSTALGIVTFYGSNTGNGNDNNILEYCNITNSGARPINAILSSGTSGRENNGNIIRNNNIYNFFNTAYGSYGVNIVSNSVGFTISDNSFYETTSFVPNVNNQSYNVIRVSTTNEHTISRNYVGGSSPLCGGTAWTVNSHNTIYYCGIFIYGGSGNATLIQNNTIANLNITSTEDNPWDGISIYSGNVNVIGNTIGATTGNSSIIITTPVAAAIATINNGSVDNYQIIDGGNGYTVAPTVTFSTPVGTIPPVATATISGGIVTEINFTSYGSGYTTAPSIIFDGQSNNYSTSHGIRHLSTGNVSITNNNIGSITTYGTNYFSHCFESIVVSGVAPTIYISNNLIGSLSTSNSIQTASSAASSKLKQDLRGIYLNSSITLATITDNTIANLYNAYNGNSISKLDGICTSGGSNIIQNNTIRNLSAVTPNIIVKGLQQTVSTAGTNQTVAGNTIYNLSNTNATAAVTVMGIDYSGPLSGTNTVTGNFIHGLTVSSTNILSVISGIMLGNGLTTIANNIINLGGGVSTGLKLYGINENSSASSSNNNNIYFNSIYLSGTANSTETSPTAALWNANNTSIRNFRNNILMNVRTGGTTGKHYAIRVAGTSGLTIDYNDYYFSGTVLGFLGGPGEKATLALWKTATAQDANSVNINPLFFNAGGTSALDYFTSAILNGVSLSGITSDYSGISRGVVPKMGALEINNYVWQGGTSTDYNTASNWSPAEVPPSGANIEFATSPSRNCVLDQNRTVGNITNTQNTYKLLVNGHQLIINKNLNFTNSAQIDATITSSEVVFAGSTAQNIPSGAFTSNTIDVLTINNSNGLTLNGDLTVNQTLTLANGNFSIGANTLSLNGAISIAAGNLIAGVTSNLVIGGLGASTGLPAITLNHLTINRSNGITMLGNVNVAGTLALTSGVLTVGVNTLTLSGNSPTSSGGIIDASNASSNLIFTNTSAITLPAIFFAAAVNNLTINGSGGVIAGSDITINGVLNLNASNPSSTKGLLEMTINYTNYPGTLITHYLNSHILNMGASATTIGTGDVTGTVKRATIVANTPYTFGHQYTTISLTPGNMPSAIAVSITIGVSPKNTKVGYDIIDDAIKRTYEILPTVDGSNCFVTANFHYLESELTSSNNPYHLNSEQKLTTMDYDIQGGYATSDEHGRANYDYTNNYIGLSSVPISYFIQIPSSHEWRTIFALRDYGVDYCTWNGSMSNLWGTAANWTLSGGGGAVVPTEFSHVIIPDATTTSYDPILPSGITTINTLSIENGGILTMGSNTLIIKNNFSGGWEDQNPLGNDPGTSKVIFSTKNTTISGNARFYDVEISDGADITNQRNNSMKIGGTITRIGSGKWYPDIFGASIEYNGGNQTILMPDGTPGYHNLLLSGSGTKTMPISALTIDQNIILSGTVSATTAADLSIGGNLIISNGTTFNIGSNNHTIGGDINIDGSLTSNNGSITLNGSLLQSIYGIGTANTTIGNLTISNSSSVGVLSDKNLIINNNLIINATSKLSISPSVNLTVSGTLSNNAGNSGFILKSDAAGTASLIHYTADVNATVENYIPTNDKYHYISSPITAAYSNVYHYAWLYNWNEATQWWDNIYQLNTPIITMKGYSLLLLNENATGTPNNPVIYANTLNTGSIGADNNITCTDYTDANLEGFNLVGNPYPSAIDWDASSGWTKTNVDNAIYFWNGSAYASYINGSGTNGGTRYIPAMQGFFVRKSNPTTYSPGTLKMDNNVRIHNDIAFLKSTISDILRLKVEGNSNSDETIIRFFDNANSGFDANYDAFKLFGYTEVPQLYTKTSDGSLLSINSQKSIIDSACVPLILKVGANGSYTITASEINSFVDNVYIILDDHKTGVSQLLNTNPVYTFNVDINDDVNRFTVRFYKNTIGIKENTNDDFTAYTFGKTIYVDLNSKNCKDAELTVINILGQEMFRKTIACNQLNSINTSLVCGYYFARIIMNEKNLVKKIYINK
jgi:hypothetical protein